MLGQKRFSYSSNRLGMEMCKLICYYVKTVKDGEMAWGKVGEVGNFDYFQENL